MEVIKEKVQLLNVLYIRNSRHFIIKRLKIKVCIEIAATLWEAELKYFRKKNVEVFIDLLERVQR
jgi:hypothetical protein